LRFELRLKEFSSIQQAEKSIVTERTAQYTEKLGEGKWPSM
jgi:hypothetical protein